MSEMKRIAQLEAALRKIEGLDSQIDASPRGERKVLRGNFANIANAALAAAPKSKRAA